MARTLRNVQSAGGGCLIVGDRLHFYVGGVSGRNATWHPDPANVGLAVLRRDVELTRDLLTRERDRRLKVTLPRRYTLRKPNVLPLALVYLIPATPEDPRP